MKGQIKMSKNGKFIITKDEHASDSLESQGLELINFSNGVYTYLNDKNVKMNFSKLKKGTYSFTDKMFF